MKKLMLICAPVTSRSGYGAHARDLVWSFLQHDKYDIKILDVRWGDCPRNALDKNDSHDKKILECILPEPTVDRQPDIYVDIRIPNEFETHGKFNIGITAGVETNAVSGKWIECCNKMDLVEDKINASKKVVDKDELDINIYDLVENIVPEKFAFLFVGQWTAGGYGEDRKDIGTLIKLFYESFANQKKQPALILKTNGATFSILSKEETLQKINSVKQMFPEDVKLPNVYLLHGDFTDDEMNSLYNHPKIKSMVSLTHGEGFGRPLLEATMTGLPVMTTAWSGQLDFLSQDKSMLIGGELQQVPKSMHWKDIIIPESKWFVVDENSTRGAMKYIIDNRYEVKNKAKSLMYENREKFTLNKMVEKLDEIIEKYTLSLPSQVQLKLPKLKKVDSSEPLKIKLPKLKKVTETSNANG